MRPLPSVSDLTLEEKVGQLLCLGWMSPDCYLHVNEQARHCVQNLKAGGMVVMGRNIARDTDDMDAAGIAAMLDEIQSLASIPLLLATDQEGGKVARFGAKPFTRMPDALTIGQRGDTSVAKEAAFIAAQELAAVGINWNLAPVADVNSNPDNPVIGDRSFSESAKIAAEMVAAQVQGYAEGGILACVKHFPGHGDTKEDSHFDLPSLPFDLSTLQNRELLPFKAAVAVGVPAIMTAHIIFRALDPDLPATMSRPILTGLLREQLGFEGLIVTDCLEMKAVADHWGVARGAVLAILAGADMVMACHTLARQQEIYDALLAAIHSGELPLQRVEDAVTRILAAKARVLSTTRPPLSVIGKPENIAFRDRLISHPVDHSRTTLGAEAPI